MKRIVVRLTLIMVMIIALPVSYFIIKQTSELNENEALVQQAFEQQLETILFTINQNSENYIVSWVNQLDVPIDCEGEVMENIVNHLFTNNPAILQISFFNTNDKGHLKSIKRSDRVIALSPAPDLIKALKTFSEQGYRRIETVRENENTFYYFIIKTPGSTMLGAIVVHSRTFVEQNLGAGIQQIAQNRFGISIIDTISGSMLYTTLPDLSDNFKTGLQQPMWYLPGKVATITLLSATIDQLVSKRAKRDSLLFYLMLSVVVAGLIFVVLTIRREVKLAELKSEFVSNVSHEIRTPLALISMYTETLLMKRVKNEEKANEYLNVIHHETNRLTSLVNRILSFSKMEKEKRGYHFDSVDVNSVIKEVIDNFEPHLKNNQIATKLILANDLPTINADREALVETVINLVDNAIKYSKENNKQIEIRTFSKNDQLHIDVEDNGIGISKKHQKLIFDKFYRVTGGDLAHKAKGSGLGLNIVKMIMDKHKGKIELRSQEGNGSCFSLIFPIK